MRNSDAGTVETRVLSPELSLCVHQWTSGKAAIEDQIRANELFDFTAAPRPPSAADRDRREFQNWLRYFPAGPRKSQHKSPTLNLDVSPSAARDGHWLLQTQESEISARVAPGNSSGYACPRRDHNRDIFIASQRMARRND